MSDTPEKEDDLLDLDQLDNEIAESGKGEEADDFLDDLNSILDEDGDGSDPAGEEAALEDLDALFDDFDDEAAAADAEAVASAADEGLESLDELLDLDADEDATDTSGPGDVLDLEEDELDLSGGDPSEDEVIVLEEEIASAAQLDRDVPAGDVGEVQATSAEEGNGAELAAAAAAVAASAATASEGAKSARSTAAPAPAGAGKLPLVALLVSLPALLIAAAGLFLAWSQGVQVAEMEQRLAESRPSASSPAQDPRVGPALDEIAALQARIGELALLIEGPMSHLSESNDQALAAIDERLTKLEAGLQEAASAPAAPVAATSPAASSDKPAASKAVGSWVVNLISVSTQQQADLEYARLKAMGYDTVITRAKVGGQTWFRLQIPGFPDYATAKSYADKARKKGLNNAWVTKG